MHATQPLKHEAGEIRIDLTTDLEQTWILEANLDTRNLLEYKTKIEYKQIRLISLLEFSHNNITMYIHFVRVFSI